MGKSRQQLDQEARQAGAGHQPKHGPRYFRAGALPERLPSLVQTYPTNTVDEDTWLDPEIHEASCDTCFDLDEESGQTGREWHFETEDGPQAALDMLYAHHLQVHPALDFDAQLAIDGMTSGMGSDPPEGSIFFDCPECKRELWARPGEEPAARLTAHYLRRHPKATVPTVQIE